MNLLIHDTSWHSWQPKGHYESNPGGGYPKEMLLRRSIQRDFKETSVKFSPKRPEATQGDWRSPKETLGRPKRSHPKRLCPRREVPKRLRARRVHPKRLRPKRLCSLINQGLFCTCARDRRLLKATQTPWHLWAPEDLWVTSKGTALTGLHPWMKSSLYLHLRRSRGWRSSTLD